MIYVISTKESQYCLNTVSHWDIHSKWGSIRQNWGFSYKIQYIEYPGCHQVQANHLKSPDN